VEAQRPFGTIQCPAKPPDWLPTPEQIATIAATLARNTKDTPDALADAAMNLWFAARARIITSTCKLEIWRQDNKLEQKTYPHGVGLFRRDLARLLEEWDQDRDLEQRIYPCGRKLFDSKLTRFPLTRDDFLRKVLPQYKNRTADLERIAKAFISEKLQQLRYVTGEESTPEAVANAYGSWKPYENAAHANEMARIFSKWYHHYVKETRRSAGKKSAAKKRKARPRWDELKKVKNTLLT
jgi:hypothetical protein